MQDIEFLKAVGEHFSGEVFGYVPRAPAGDVTKDNDVRAFETGKDHRVFMKRDTDICEVRILFLRGKDAIAAGQGQKEIVVDGVDVEVSEEGQDEGNYVGLRIESHLPIDTHLSANRLFRALITLGSRIRNDQGFEDIEGEDREVLIMFADALAEGNFQERKQPENAGGNYSAESAEKLGGFSVQLFSRDEQALDRGINGFAELSLDLSEALGKELEGRGRKF